jgi:hypothetical protein
MKKSSLFRSRFNSLFIMLENFLLLRLQARHQRRAARQRREDAHQRVELNRRLDEGLAEVLPRNYPASGSPCPSPESLGSSASSPRLQRLYRPFSKGSMH